MRGYKEVLEYRYGSPGLLTHDKWIALPRRMALGWNHASLNYRVFQQNSWKADVGECLLNTGSGRCSN